MGKIVNATYMTLDGDIQNMGDWHFAFFGEEAAQTAQEQLDAADALIMGRATYDRMAPAWTARAGEDTFADRMNEITKYVVSNSLTRPAWQNVTVVNGDVAGRLREIRQLTDRDIVQYGFGPVTRLLLENGLLDELRIWLHPVLSGKAKPEDLLYRDMPRTTFTLADANVHSTGIVVLTYRPA
jgi:dihydrofolate reductase